MACLKICFPTLTSSNSASQYLMAHLGLSSFISNSQDQASEKIQEETNPKLILNQSIAKSFRIFSSTSITSKFMLNGYLLEKKSLRNIQDDDEENELQDSVVHALEIDRKQIEFADIETDVSDTWLIQESQRTSASEDQQESQNYSIFL